MGVSGFDALKKELIACRGLLVGLAKNTGKNTKAKKTSKVAWAEMALAAA